MRETYHLSGKEPTTREVVGACYPGYPGTTYKLCVTDTAIQLPPRKPGTHWDVVFYDLNTKQADPMPTPMRRRTSYPPIVLPANTLAVEHLYQRSRDQGLTIYVMVRDVTTEMLPELQTVTREEEIYMRITLNEPASVRGDYRHRQHVAERTAGWSFERWRQVRARLLKRHLVNGNSVLTKWGLNVLTYRDSKLLRHLKTAAPIHAAR